MKTIIISERHKKAFKKRHKQNNKPAAQEQVGQRANCELVAMAAGMCEGVEEDTYTIGAEVPEDGIAELNPYYHIKEDRDKELSNPPKKCDKCGGEVILKIAGEPVYVCKECGKYFGTRPFRVNEERGIAIADNMDKVKSICDYIKANYSNYITPKYLEKITIKHSRPSFCGRGNSDSWKEELEKQPFNLPSGALIYKSQYKAAIPDNVTRVFDFVDHLKVTLKIVDFETESTEPEDLEHIDYLMQNSVVKGGERAGKFDCVTKDGTKLEWTTTFKSGKVSWLEIILTFAVYNGKLANPSGIDSLFTHEVIHCLEEYRRMSRGEKWHLYSRENSGPHQWAENFMNDPTETPGRKALGALYYALFEGNELEAHIGQIYGDLTGLDSRRGNFQNDLKASNTWKEFLVLRDRALKDLKEYGVDWDYCGYHLGLLKRYPKLKDFIKECEKRIQKYLNGVGKVASLYYDRQEAAPQQHMNEETDPESIDLSSFKIQDELNKKFWKEDRLDSRIRMKLLDIADDFVKTLGVNWVEPDDITMTGSLANYNWSKDHSDIDLHIIMDYKKVDERTDFVAEYFKDKKTIWNENHENLKIFGFPVEVYVQDKSGEAVAGGVYSLEKDKWINKPVKKEMSDAGLDTDKIQKDVASYIDRIEELENNLKDSTDDEFKSRKISEKADKLFDEIVKTRRDALKSAKKEMCDGNIVFKALRRMGYLDKLCDLSNEAYDKMNSLVAEERALKGWADPDEVEADGQRYRFDINKGTPRPYYFKDDEFLLGRCCKTHYDMSKDSFGEFGQNYGRTSTGKYKYAGRIWAGEHFITNWCFDTWNVDNMSLDEYLSAYRDLIRKIADGLRRYGYNDVENWEVLFKKQSDDKNNPWGIGPNKICAVTVKEALQGESNADAISAAEKRAEDWEDAKNMGIQKTKDTIYDDPMYRMFVAEGTEKQTAYLMVGIPGSGKSTWIKNNLGDIDVVSRDIIRSELGFTSSPDEKAVCTKEQENEVTEKEYSRIKELADSGKDFVIDDTNTGKFRRKMIGMLRELGLHITVVRMNTDIETCIKRREGQIPADVMRRLHSGLIEPAEDEYDDLLSINEEHLHSLTAYHGTPHDFIKFQTKNIGTGEGNQSFGYGLYFTDNKGVAEFYADLLSNHEGGIIYTVEISEGEFFDWLSPLDEETIAKMKSALIEMGIDKLPVKKMFDFNTHKINVVDKDIDEALHYYPNGKFLYENISLKFGGDQNASQFLRKLGFIGIKYPVGAFQGKRMLGENYVIFSGDDVKIVNKETL